MEQLSVLATPKRQNVARITRNSKIFKTIIHAIQEKKGENIISIDLRKIHEAVADFVEEETERVCGELPYKQEGRQAMQWVLIDYVNIVVHVMLPESRKFYKLEEMWNDGNTETY